MRSATDWELLWRGRAHAVLGFAAIVVATALSGGCDGRDPSFSRAHAIGKPFEVGGALVWRDVARERLVVVTESGGAPVVKTFTYAGGVDTSDVTPDGTRLLLVDRDARKLTSFSPSDGTAREWPLPSELNGLRISEDSKTALLFHEPGSGGSDTLVNVAELTLVDLGAPAVEGSNPRTATVNGLAKAPNNARVGPEVDGAAGKHRVAWLEAPSALGVADFGPGGGKVRTAVVALVPADSTVALYPTRVVPKSVPGGLDLYLIATGSNDVFHVSLALGGADLTFVVNQIAAGAGPSDLHVHDGSAGTRILTLSTGAWVLSVLDPSTGSGMLLPLDRPTSTIVPFSSGGKARALLWTPGAGDVLRVVDLEDLAKKKGKAIKTYATGSSVSKIVPVGDRFVLQHPGSSGGLSIFEGATGKFSSFQGSGAVSDLRVQGDRIFALRVVGGHGLMTRLTTSTLALEDIAIELAGSQLARFGSDGIAYVGQGLGGVWLALFPSGALKADKSTFLEGFTLTEVM